MKTMINKIAMATMIAIFTTVQLFAFEDSLKINGNDSFDLVISDVCKKTQITFKDKHNNILFEQIIDKKENYAKTFNLELLPDGDYIVEIEDDIKTRILPVNINNDVVNLSDSEIIEYFKPVVNEKGSKIYVSQFSPNGSPLYVAIYNDRDELIHEETLQGKMDLGKIFDFSKSMNGHYFIYLESMGRTYDHLVYLEK